MRSIWEDNSDSDGGASDFAESVEVELVTPFVGRWENAELGAVTLALDENKVLTLDAGEWVSVILPALDADGEIDTYLLMSPPLASVPVFFNEDDGVLTLVIRTGLIVYPFERVD